MRLWPGPGQDDAIADTSEIRSALIRFLLVGLASLVLVAIPTVFLLETIAKDHALKAALASGRNLSINLLPPQMVSGAIVGDKTALAQIDSIVRSRMRDGSIARIKIWDTNGRIIYSDKAALIDRVYPLPEVASLRLSGQSGVAKVSLLDERENEFETGSAELVEVYSLATTSSGKQLLFEAYFPISSLNQAQNQLRLQMAPVALSALVILNLSQLPSALHLARQVQHSRRSRQRLLLQAVAAADHERRRLAQRLHDEVIQDLAGVGYALSSLGEHSDVKDGPGVERIAMIVRRDVELLRAMVTELYPQDLDLQSLGTSLSELAGPLREAGVQVEVEVDEPFALDETTATVVFKVARESLHNAKKHAQPRNVELRLASTDDRIVLTVVDDGRGFDPTAAPKPGHFGLKLIRDIVTEAGGTLMVDSVIGQGTRVELSLPRT